ncbi:hypothetical protein ABPG72_008933 [Tetrahymena utriculariae]
MGQCCSSQNLPDLINKTDLNDSMKVQIYGPADCEILGEQDDQQILENEIRINVNLMEYKNKYLIEVADNIGEQRVFLPYLKLQKNGVIYKGQWKNKQMDGYGQIIIPSKAYYCGKFEKGKLQGSGVVIHSNGDIYEGTLKNGAADEFGKFKTITGEKYEGYWKNDQKHGKGVFQSTLYKYDGHYDRGQKQGSGELEIYHLFKYTGSFQNNMFQGEGEITYLDGSQRKYKGSFNNNRKSGQGCFTWPSCEYEGSYKDDLRNGLGEINFKEGTKVSGMFVNGYLNGEATILKGENNSKAQFINGEFNENNKLSDEIKKLFILNDFDEDIH